MMKLGIIGIGNMGSAHADCLAKGEIAGAELTAVCDCRKERRRLFSEEYPNIQTYENYKDLLADENIEGVIIATPHFEHAKIAMEALDQGLHVLLEKPMDVSCSKAQLLEEKAAASGKVFSMMFNQRTNPLFAKAREIVQGGLLGEMKRSVWIITNWYRSQAYYDSGDWRATWAGEGGGVLLNQAPHNLDLWQWICGMPKSITAHCDVGKFHDIEVEDDVTIFARYENGATGTLITSTGEYPGTNRLEITGTLGKIVLEHKTLKWWRLAQSEREVCKDSQENSPKPEYEYEEFQKNGGEVGHKGILQNFVNAVTKGEALLAPGKDGICELMISNAAYLSSWLGGKEVTLPFDTEQFDKLLEERIAGSVKKEGKAKPCRCKGYEERWKVNW